MENPILAAGMVGHGQMQAAAGKTGQGIPRILERGGKIQNRTLDMSNQA
jgi:hypothetical protein